MHHMRTAALNVRNVLLMLHFLYGELVQADLSSNLLTTSRVFRTALIPEESVDLRFGIKRPSETFYREQV